MHQQWVTQRERGSVFAMKLITRLSLVLGRRFGRLLLYPVCVYFMIFSGRGRRASRQFLNKALARRVGLRDIFQHHYFFASTLLDRAFLCTGHDEQFEIAPHGLEIAQNFAARGQGCLLLGAHLGSFEFSRHFGSKRDGLVINTMMYEQNAKKINQVLKSLDAYERMKVITIGGVDALLQAKERIDRGEQLAMLGDRIVASDKIVSVPFFGQPAVFPAGPILIANALKVPVVLFFSLYMGGNRYAEHYELFADRIVLDPRRRQADLEKWVGLYVGRLEHYCRRSPYNWFNFFDFWEYKPKAHGANRDSRSNLVIQH